MKKNLGWKVILIIVTLLVFVWGFVLGTDPARSLQAIKDQGLVAGIQQNIHLGLDLKGGTHLILQVMVNDAVNADGDHAIELLKDELTKAKIAFADISKPDEKNQPERIVVKGVALDAGPQLRGNVTDRLPEYDVSSGPDNSWILVMKATVLNDLKVRTVEQSIEAIRTRVDSLGVSEPVIQQNGLGENQILVQLPGVDDPGRVKTLLS